MGRNADYQNGEREGVRQCVAWLHRRAAAMNDHHAKAVLNSAAYHLGLDLKTGTISIPPDCDHEWIDVRNSVVQSGSWCQKCGALSPNDVSN